MTVRLWVALAVTFLVIGFAFGALWRERAHAGWLVDRDAALAQADSARGRVALFQQDAALAHRRADSLGIEAQRLDALARRQLVEASRARMSLVAYRDSVKAAGDTLIPLARLEEAVVVIDSQQAVIATQRAVIRTLAADTATLAHAGRLHEQAAAHWRGAAEELEQTLKGYRAQPKPRLLGFLPAPSPTVSFLLGATVTFVATR